jgi:hypothetical protein
MSHRYQADVYILLQSRGRYVEYTSIDSPLWPTPAVEFVRKPLLFSDLLLTKRQSKTYPPPIRKRPAHFMRRRRLGKENKDICLDVDDKNPTPPSQGVCQRWDGINMRGVGWGQFVFERVGSGSRWRMSYITEDGSERRRLVRLSS